tara:strand:- start:100 stop:297 length:198 start_codon:yes stop_codon:yes gene_type:complete
MKIPNIRFKTPLGAKINDSLNRIVGLSEADKKVPTENNKRFIHDTEGSKDQPLILYANQINIEQL